MSLKTKKKKIKHFFIGLAILIGIGLLLLLTTFVVNSISGSKAAGEVWGFLIFYTIVASFFGLPFLVTVTLLSIDRRNEAS